MFNQGALSGWRMRRKFFYMIGAGALILGTFLLLFWSTIFPTPTCMDGRKNGGERGVDCGGKCARMCIADVTPLQVMWTRPLQVTDKVWSVVSMIENRNALASPNFAYTMSLYDETNMLIASKSNTIFIPALTRMPIFVGGFEVNGKVPKFASMTITNSGDWYTPPMQSQGLSMNVSNIEFTSGDTPRLTARITNNSLYTLTHVPVSAMLYDTASTLVGASETYIDSLDANKSATVFFTWPRPFTMPIGVKDVLPRVNPFTLTR